MPSPTNAATQTTSSATKAFRRKLSEKVHQRRLDWPCPPDCLLFGFIPPLSMSDWLSNLRAETIKCIGSCLSPNFSSIVFRFKCLLVPSIPPTNNGSYSRSVSVTFIVSNSSLMTHQRHRRMSSATLINAPTYVRKSMDSVGTSVPDLEKWYAGMKLSIQMNRKQTLYARTLQ